MTHTLEYGKIILRSLEPEDIDLLYNWENNQEIWQVSNTRTPFSKHILAKYILDSSKDIYETRQLRLVIESKEGKPVGAIDLFDFDPYHMRAGIGVLIHDNNDRKKGFANDALEAISAYALENLGVHQLYANITTDNTNSIRLFERVGFLSVGVKKDWIRTPGGWKDEITLQKILGTS